MRSQTLPVAESNKKVSRALVTIWKRPICEENIGAALLSCASAVPTAKHNALIVNIARIDISPTQVLLNHNREAGRAYSECASRSRGSVTEGERRCAWPRIAHFTLTSGLQMCAGLGAVYLLQSRPAASYLRSRGKSGALPIHREGQLS